MNTEQGNKLIADFMGLEQFENPFRGIKKEDGLYKRTNADGTADIIGDLNYAVSWDWLMPVVEKIENLKDHIEVNISGTDCTIWYLPDLKPVGVTRNWPTKIEAVYNAVVSFIRWYNRVVLAEECDATEAASSTNR